MAVTIVIKDRVFTKVNKSKIGSLLKDKGYPMKSSMMRDIVTPVTRLTVPFRFRWLKFKTVFFGLVIQKGVKL